MFYAHLNVNLDIELLVEQVLQKKSMNAPLFYPTPEYKPQFPSCLFQEAHIIEAPPRTIHRIQSNRNWRTRRTGRVGNVLVELPYFALAFALVAPSETSS
jgi:hypothetical protein